VRGILGRPAAGASVSVAGVVGTRSSGRGIYPRGGAPGMLGSIRVLCVARGWRLRVSVGGWCRLRRGGGGVGRSMSWASVMWYTK
jgi:hypothetical protein